jgi:hypothetical protein
MHALCCVTHTNMCNYYRKIDCIDNIPSDVDDDADIILSAASMYMHMKSK